MGLNKKLAVAFMVTGLVAMGTGFWLFLGNMGFLKNTDSGVPVKSGGNAGKGEISLVLVGDIMLGRGVEIVSRQKGDPGYPFLKVAERVREADIVFGNLENPIVENCPVHSEGFKFCATPWMIGGLVFSGVDVVSLANNHSLNYGREGLAQTKRLLLDQGIDSVGVGELLVREAGGVKFGFMGFEYVGKGFNKGDLEKIRKADQGVDVLVVGVHWGEEYKSEPGRGLRDWGEKMIEAGADVVSGHHPHWVQGWEYIGGKPVFWSLGNFVFDQMWSEKTRQGMGVWLRDEGNTLKSVETIPTFMEAWAQPSWLESEN